MPRSTRSFVALPLLTELLLAGFFFGSLTIQLPRAFLRLCIGLLLLSPLKLKARFFVSLRLESGGTFFRLLRLLLRFLTSYFFRETLLRVAIGFDCSVSARGAQL